MNKRSAVLIAAGLVLIMAVGGLAVSLGLTGPTPVNATGAVRPERVVKVERKTVTVHRKADQASGSATQIAVAPGTVTGDDSDDGFEGEDEHGFEDEDHEDHDDDGFEIEDD